MPHYKVILHALGLNNYNMVTYNIYSLLTISSIVYCCVVFVVHRVALGRVSLRVLRFPLSIIPQCSVLMHSTTRCFTRRLEGNFPTSNVLSDIEVCLIRNTPNSPLPVTLSALPSALPFFQPTLTRRTRGHCLGIGNLQNSISVMSVLVSTLKWWSIKYKSVYLCLCWMSSDMEANLTQITWGCYGDYGAMYFLRRLLYREEGGGCETG
jgi:hypothetical protein